MPGNAEQGRLLSLVAWFLVTGFGLWLLWPIPLGQMPLSADHTVHLSRITQTADLLAQGHVRGWSPTWFFGSPIGELYPPLGDLFVISIRLLSLGALTWPQAYAIGFTGVFVAQGWVLWALGRCLGFGPVVGCVAGCLILADPGYAREGGWLYTTWFGVWPQALATSLCWLGLAHVVQAIDRDTSAQPGTHLETTTRRYHATRAAAWLGAALLAHPMTATMLLIATPLLILVIVVRLGPKWPIRLVWCGAVLVVAVLLASWWWLPMLAHRHFMASYGWLHVSLSTLVEHAMDGQWSERMPSNVGYLATLGLVYIIGWGSPRARFFAAFALIQWTFAASDVYGLLRPDRISLGFSHIQYQRFIPAAKPGFFLAAGVAVGVLVRTASRWRPKLVAGLPATAAVFVLLGLAVDSGRRMHEHAVGDAPLERRAKVDDFEHDYAQLVAWLREHAPSDDEFFRYAFRAGRNVHWLMDAPALADIALYKAGFTPGDNFVHKPESEDPRLLDQLRVRYVITTGRQLTHEHEVARFGSIRVLERRGELAPIATLSDDGDVEVLDARPEEGVVRVRANPRTPNARLTFHVSGYPRWHLTLNGEPLEWYEVAPLDPTATATVESRQAGQWIGGKALGHDGTEPMLIAADLPHGGFVTLSYRYWQWFDIVGWAASLLGVAGLVFLRGGAWGVRWPQGAMWCERTIDGLARHLRPAVLGSVVLLGAGALAIRWQQQAAHEASTAAGWLDDEAASARSMYSGLLKTDMLIRPAVLVSRRHRKQAVLSLPNLQLGPRLTGWLALEDDEAQFERKGTHRFVVEIRSDTDEATLYDAEVSHRPGRVHLDFDTRAFVDTPVELRVRVSTDGKAPRLGFNFDLPTAAP